MKRLFLSSLIISVFCFGLVMTGCGRMIGAPDLITAPTVTLTVPANLATGVFVNRSIVATFSKLMDPTTLNSPATTFTLLRGTTNVPGTVTYVGFAATFKPTVNLDASTTYTAVITTAAKDLTGNALAATKTWTFTTGTSVDITPPTVTLTNPLNLATAVPINQAIASTFSEPMNPLTVNSPATTFTLKVQGGAAVDGTVTSIGQITTFTPTSNLATSTTYEATISTGAEDLAGNGLAVNKVWTFTTGAAADITRPTVTATAPLDNATNEALSVKLIATLSKAMNPATLTNLTFTLKVQGVAAVDGAVTSEGTSATFTPTSNLVSNTTYEARISTGAKDLAGNALASDKVWTFKTQALAPFAVPLNLVSTYGLSAYSAISAAGPSTIEGDATIKINPVTSMTGYFQTDGGQGQVTGSIHCADAVALQVYNSLNAAYHFAADPPSSGTHVPDGTDLGTLITSLPTPGHLPAGTYWNASTITINTPVVLDGQGNPDAVWIFQIGSSLTTVAGTPGGNVTLTGGAQAKNVFFVPQFDATIGGGTTFNGNILAGRNVTCSGTTHTIVNGRLLAGATGIAGAIALDNTAGATINVPLP